MGSSANEPLLGEERVCASRCGFSDEKSRAADKIARANAAKKLGLASVFCLIFIAVELAGGIISNSLAILTDAAHLLSDVAGFGISLLAIWASSWEATPRQSYGFFRLEILGALLSIQLIWLLTGIIVYEAIYRLTRPSEFVDGRLMFIVATFGLVVNIIMVFLLGHHGHDHSHGHGHGHSHSHGHGHGHSHSHGHGHGHSHSHGHSDEHHKVSSQSSKHISGDHHTHTHDDDHHSHSHSENNQVGGNHSHMHHHGHDHNHGSITHHDNHVHQHNHIHDAHSHGGLLERNDSYTVDMDVGSQKTNRSSVGNINVQGAWLHVFGDLIQSIGVMIGGAIIWWKPEWKIVDLICTLLFSALVLGTTIKMLRDIMEILMESTPREIDVKKLEKGLCEIDGVVAIHELHIWAITMGKTLLACHVTIRSDGDSDAILERVLGYCERVFNISHVTVQIERLKSGNSLERLENCKK